MLWKKVLNYYKKFLNFSEIANSSYISKVGDEKQRGIRQIKAKQIKVSQDKIEVMIDNHITSYLIKYISPISRAKNQEGEMQDQNKLLLGLLFVKVYFEETDTNIYFPLVSYDITDLKEQIINQAMQTGSATITLENTKEKIEINRPVIDFLYSFKSLFGKEQKEINDFFAQTIEGFIPSNYRTDIRTLNKYLIDYFKKHESENKDFKIYYPEVINEKSVAFMFFNSRTEFKKSQEFDKVNEDEELLIEYLENVVEEPKKIKQSLIPDLIWYGSLTRDYPLGKGQALVMQKNQMNERIIPVVGGPGTGKTTLFLSIIAQEVTKRAISNIRDGIDYNNLMIVTSTSNKAVENVYKSLQKGFSHGFVYVGGNQENKENSKRLVEEFISWFRSFDYDKKKQDTAKKSIERILSFIERKRNEFEKIHSEFKYKYGIKNMHDLQVLKNKIEGEVLVIPYDEFRDKFTKISSLRVKINRITHKVFSVQAIEDLINKENIIENLELVLQKIKKASFFKKMFSKDSMTKEAVKEFGLKINSFEELEILTELLKEFQALNASQLLEIKAKKEILQEIESVMRIYQKKPKSLDRILKAESFAEFARTNFYSLNYRLYLKCWDYLFQQALKQKDKVIKAVKYLIADNGYQYIKENFGYKRENIEEMLKLISLVYPVATSTLASITNMFPGIYPEKVPTYNTILADEAGMINVMDMIPVMRRADRAIVVGDPKQLPPIIQVEDFFYDKLNESYTKAFIKRYCPTKVSAYHRAASTIAGGYKHIGRGIILDEHRRCAPKIARLFIDIAEYEGLKICTRTPKNAAFEKVGEELFFFDVKNTQKRTYRKVNLNEIALIRSILLRLQKAGYNPQTDIGIITPYREQESELIKYFGEYLGHSNEKAKIGTVHKFQGAEYKVVIFSPVVSHPEDSLTFINNDPSMINVAISRAKEIFMVVGDYEKLTSEKSPDNFIGKMAEKIKEIGIYVPTASKKSVQPQIQETQKVS